MKKNKTLITISIITVVLAGISAITTYTKIIDNSCNKSNEQILRLITEIDNKGDK